MHSLCVLHLHLIIIEPLIELPPNINLFIEPLPLFIPHSRRAHSTVTLKPAHKDNTSLSLYTVGYYTDTWYARRVCDVIVAL